MAHPVEGVELVVKLLVFVVGAGAHSVDFFGEILFERSAGVEEFLEGDFQFLLPKELLVIVLVNEVVGGVLDLVKAVCDLLLAEEEDELIFDFDQIVSIVGSVSRVRTGIKTAGHLD